LTFSYSVGQVGWHTIRIRNGTDNQVGQKCWVKANYKAPQIVNTAVVKNKCACSSIAGINEIQGLEALIYPNPATDELYYEFGNKLNDNYRIQIIDLEGKILYTDSISNSKGKIEVSAIKNGYYFFTILNSSGEFVVKQFTKY
jgi:hypothetical protein